MTSKGAGESERWMKFKVGKETRRVNKDVKQLS